ncbi:MAG: hypothetical protein LBK44_03090 [Spirochaetales bacterium]|jgi:hypothetical protein|nr:hypothetical protein [Spirochaetales bacterium]
MRFLWAFRCNPGRMGEQRICDSKFVTSPSRKRQRLFALRATYFEERIHR